MRGLSQSRLVKASDGGYYVVKFRGNPKGTVSLAREIINSALYREFNLPVPENAMLRLDPNVVEGDYWPSLTQSDGESIPVEAGWHFGSKFPCDPTNDAAYDYIPERLLPQVRNCWVFSAASVIDRWLWHGPDRQTVYTRGADKTLSVYFIDHTASWFHQYENPRIGGLSLPNSVLDPETVAATRSHLAVLTNECLDSIFELPPPEWTASASDELERGKAILKDRRDSLREDSPLLRSKHRTSTTD